MRESCGTISFLLLSSSAFLVRSYVLGDWGMAARMAAWAIVSLARSVTPK